MIYSLDMLDLTSFIFSYFIVVCLFGCFFFLMIRRPPRSTRTDTLFPYTTLFRSHSRLRGSDKFGWGADVPLFVTPDLIRGPAALGWARTQKESGTPGRARGDERGNGGNSPKSVSLRYLSTSPNTFAPCTCPDAPVRSPLRALSPMPARQVPKTGRKRASPPAYPVPLCPSAKPVHQPPIGAT